MANLITIASAIYQAGARESNVFAFPGNGYNTIQVAFIMDPLDLVDATKTMAFALMIRQPDLSFLKDSGFTWQGGGSLIDKNGNPITGPIMSTSVSNLIGQTCKLTMNLNKSVTFAVSVSTL